MSDAQDDAEKIEAFYAKDGAWAAEMRALRALLLDCGLSEERKWRQPCYTAHGGNIAMPAAFKDSCRLTFFKGVLLKDPAGILTPVGENARSACAARFTGLDQIGAVEDTLRSYVAEAVALQKAGAKVVFEKDDLDPPEELSRVLDSDPALAEAFAALTPGRKRSYYLHVGQAKQSDTRLARIEKARDHILAGKNFQGR